jgi:hypothetical protein
MSNYEPPKTDADLLLSWLRRARESQFAHYAAADKLLWKGQALGGPVILLTTIVGASAFTSVATQVIPTYAKLLVGAFSVLAAVMSGLQTYFKFSERADKHRVFGAKYGALRRELEQVHASGGKTTDALRKSLDKLAEEAPAVSESVYREVASTMDH